VGRTVMILALQVCHVKTSRSANAFFWTQSKSRVTSTFQTL